MNNRYTLPIAVAAAVHTVLALGFRHSGVIPVTSGPTVVIPTDVIKLEPFKEWIDPVETDEKAKAVVNQQRSTSEEPLPRPDPGPITFKAPATPHVRTNSPNLEIPTIGIPGGIELGTTNTPGIFSARHLDKSPHAQVQAAPDYPFSAKREGFDGNVVVEFLVDETGRVADPRIVSSTNPVFDEPSLRAVMKWRFEPGRREGKVVRFKMAVPVVFRLNNN